MAVVLRYTTNIVAVSSRWRRTQIVLKSTPRAPWRKPPSRRSLSPALPVRHVSRARYTVTRELLSASLTSEYSLKFLTVLWYCSRFNMKKQDSECSLSRSVRGRPARLLTDSISSEEGQETERLIVSQLPAAVVAAASGRRQSLTAPPSPTDYRKKHHQRHHNYMNQLQHLIHWRDIWGGEPHKGQEVLRLMICNKCYNHCWLTSFLTFFVARRKFLCTIFVYPFFCPILRFIVVGYLLYTSFFQNHFLDLSGTV